MQSEKVQAREFGGHAAKDQTQIQTFSMWINHPEWVHKKCYRCDYIPKNSYSLIYLIVWNKEGGVMLSNFSCLEKGAWAYRIWELLGRVLIIEDLW